MAAGKALCKATDDTLQACTPRHIMWFGFMTSPLQWGTVSTLANFKVEPTSSAKPNMSWQEGRTCTQGFLYSLWVSYWVASRAPYRRRNLKIASTTFQWYMWPPHTLIFGTHRGCPINMTYGMKFGMFFSWEYAIICDLLHISVFEVWYSDYVVSS